MTPLHVDAAGDPAGPPVVLLHGFTQSGASWAPVAARLGRHRRVLTLDAPGHGRSAGVAAGLHAGADLMAEAVGGPAAWVGYSMGGRYALHVALRHPLVVERLVLVSTTAGIDDPAGRAARRRSDDELARRVEREGVDAFVRWWLGRPLFATLAPEAAAMDSRRGGSAAGLASSLRLAGTGVQEPLWDRLAELAMPVLVVAGELDAKYRDLAERLVEGIGADAALAVVPGAGHACHLERPEEFTALVDGWL